MRLVLVGAGRNLDRVVSQVAELGLDNVVVAGLQPPGEIPGILAWADTCLIPLAPDPYLGINIPSELAVAVLQCCSATTQIVEIAGWAQGQPTRGDLSDVWADSRECQSTMRKSASA